MRHQALITKTGPCLRRNWAIVLTADHIQCLKPAPLGPGRTCQQCYGIGQLVTGTEGNALGNIQRDSHPFSDRGLAERQATTAKATLRIVTNFRVAIQLQFCSGLGGYTKLCSLRHFPKQAKGKGERHVTAFDIRVTVFQGPRGQPEAGFRTTVVLEFGQPAFGVDHIDASTHGESITVVNGNGRAECNGGQLGLVREKAPLEVILVIRRKAIGGVQTEAHVQPVVDFVGHVKIGKDGRVGDITTVSTGDGTAVIANGTASAFLELGINIQNGGTKRHIGAGKLAHAGRIEENRSGIFRIGCGAGVSNAHGTGTLLIE